MERLTTKGLCTVDLKDAYDIPCSDVCERNISCETCSIQKAFNKLAHYEDLEEQGLLLKLHFGKGDVVYEVVEGGDGEHYVVPKKCHTNALLIMLNEKVGERVFLTKAEAEKALEEMKEKEK